MGRDVSLVASHFVLLTALLVVLPEPEGLLDLDCDREVRTLESPPCWLVDEIRSFAFFLLGDTRLSIVLEPPSVF